MRLAASDRLVRPPRNNKQPAFSELTCLLKNHRLANMKHEFPVLSIDHVAIAVIDLEQTARWYQDVLGFEIIEKRFTEGNHTAMNSVVLKSGSAVLVLIQGTTPDSQVNRFIAKFGPGVQHLALAVDDIDAAIAQAGNDNLEIEPIESEGLRQVFLKRDPVSGVRIELIERRGGTFSDDSVRRLFRAFEHKDVF